MPKAGLTDSLGILKANGLVTNGLVTNVLEANGLVTNVLEANVLEANGLVANVLEANGLVANVLEANGHSWLFEHVFELRPVFQALTGKIKILNT